MELAGLCRRHRQAGGLLLLQDPVPRSVQGIFEANGAGRRAKGLSAGRLGKRSHRHGHLYGIPQDHVRQKRCQRTEKQRPSQGYAHAGTPFLLGQPGGEADLCQCHSHHLRQQLQAGADGILPNDRGPKQRRVRPDPKERYGQRPGHGIRSGTGRDHSPGSDGAKRGRMGLVDRLRLWRLHRRTGVSGQRQPSSRDLQAAVGTGQLLQIHRRG